jgi:hypothetical protein
MTTTRREALRAIGVTATVAGLVQVPALTAKAAVAPKRARTKQAKTAAPRWLGDLDGARFAGCLVHAVGPVANGSVAVTLSDRSGEFFVVEVLRHDAATPGVARGGSSAVFMKIDGEARATREEHGLAAMALATELGRREESGLAVPALLTLRQRAAVRRSA